MNDIINAVRKSLTPDEQHDFDRSVGAHSDPALKYQAAFSFLALRRPPHVRDRVIQIATLAAYRGELDQAHPLSAANLQTYESDVDNWKLSTGVESLGRIWAGLPSAVRGPVITTNFDPLVEISIRKAGRDVFPHIMDADGAFIREVAAVDIPQVVHIHGYWRDSATLSMTSQLTQDRVALNSSVRSLLSQYTLLVVGYGAWDDAFTRQLSTVIREQSARELDVLWCSFGTDADFAQEITSNELLGHVQNAPGNVQFYTQIDANSFFPTLEKEIGDILTFSEGQRHARGRGTLVGWLPVPSAPPKDADGAKARASALRFFDGRLPTWRDAANPLVPRRDLTNSLVNWLRAAVRHPDPTLNLITGPSGEGKTTLLMQVAAEMATGDPDLVVLFSNDGAVGSTNEVLNLPKDSKYLLVVDDAYRSVERLRALVTKIHESERSGIHLLAASRDSDWTSVAGFGFNWSRYLSTTTHRLRGLERLDAYAIVQAWESIGVDALGALVAQPDTEARVQSLLTAAADPDFSSDGALLGALLQTRYGDALHEHIRELLFRLGERPVHSFDGQATELTLLDVFYTIALPHAAGVNTLSQRLLARALGLAEYELVGAALAPLGDEAAISFSSDTVSVRHRMIASTAMSLAREIGYDQAKAVRALVTAAVAEVASSGMTPALHPFAYFSNHLKTPGLDIVAAQAAVDSEPRRLSYRSTLSRTLRESGRVADALAACDEAAAHGDFEDATDGIRPFLNEWGVVHGNLGNWACNVVLSGLSAADDAGGSGFHRVQVGPAVACLAFALRRMWETTNEYVFLNGLSALLSLTTGLNQDSAQRRWAAEAESVIGKAGVSPATDLSTCQQQLVQACAKARTRTEVPIPGGFASRQFSFHSLRRISADTQ